MRQLAIVILLCSAFASSTAALAPDDRLDRLPEKYRAWLEEEVVYIISKVERETFLDLETESEREAFIAAFWKRRDTNPATLENEFREEHYKRLAYANEFLGRDTFRPGWMTDRGRYYIILGPPTDIQNFSHEDAIYPTELWFYNNPELKQYGLPPFFYLLFWRRNGSGELQLYSPGMDGPPALLTGYQTVNPDFRQDIENAYNALYEISPELAQASLSFLTDEGDIAQFQAPSFGTLALMEQILEAPLRGVDTSYAERFYAEKGTVESDYLFNYVPSWSSTHVLPGPGGTSFLHWDIEVDPQSIALVQDPDRNLFGTQFNLSVELVPKDHPNHPIIALRKESFMQLKPSEAQTGSRHPFSYSGMVPVIPGSFDVRIILRNRACPGREESTCVKSYTVLETAIDVPEPGGRQPHLTPLILAYATERAEGEPVYRPYRFGTLQILPNPRRVYSIGETVTAVTEPRATEPGSQARFRILNRDVPDKIELERTAPAGQLLEPVVQNLSLEGFSGGRYELVADLIDADGNVLDTQAADFDVTPRTAVARPYLRGSWPQVLPEVPGLVEMALGEQYLNLENKAKARELFEASVEANPRLGPAREALSRLLLDEGDNERVVALLDPIYEAEPNRFQVLVLLGEAYFQQKSYDKTIELLEKAITLQPPESHVLNLLAVSQYEKGNAERARELLQRSLSLNPDQPPVEELLRKWKTGSSGGS